jgi:hypothetical protein
MDWLESLRDRWRRVWADESPTSVAENEAASAPEPPVVAPVVADGVEPEHAEPVSLERYAERLLEDERARSNLTDEEFQPLLDWALDTLEQVTAEPSPGTEQSASRSEAATAAIREILATVNDAFEDGQAGGAAGVAEQLRPLIDVIGPPIVRPDRVDVARRRIERAIESLAEQGGPVDGADITGRLAEALRPDPEHPEELSA